MEQRGGGEGIERRGEGKRGRRGKVGLRKRDVVWRKGGFFEGEGLGCRQMYCWCIVYCF